MNTQNLIKVAAYAKKKKITASYIYQRKTDKIILVNIAGAWFVDEENSTFKKSKK